MTNGYNGTAEMEQGEQRMAAKPPQPESAKEKPKPAGPGEETVRETEADRPAGE